MNLSVLFEKIKHCAIAIKKCVFYEPSDIVEMDSRTLERFLIGSVKGIDKKHARTISECLEGYDIPDILIKNFPKVDFYRLPKRTREKAFEVLKYICLKVPKKDGVIF